MLLARLLLKYIQMLERLKKILALTMVLMIFISSHSFAYFEHLCTVTYKKTLSLDLETCLSNYISDEDLEDLSTPPTDVPAFQKNICCEVDLKTHQAGNFYIQKVNLANQVLAENTIPVFNFSSKVMLDKEVLPLIYANTSPPPLIPIYLMQQVFII